MTFDNTPAQVVVIEDRKRRKGLAWLAGGAALALLLSGGTFALWRASASFTGGQVTAGDLDLTGCDELTWYDISPDRADATGSLATAMPGIDLTQSELLASSGTGSINELALAKSAYTTTYPAAYTTYLVSGDVKAHAIDDIDTWKMVPGDTVVALCEGALITLEGDNLVAALEMTDADGNVIDFSDSNSDWTGVVTGAEVYANGELATPGTGGALGYFAAPNEDGSQDAGIRLEGNGATEIFALQTDATLATSDANADDLRTATVNDGRLSLGQGYATAMFVVHFIDDGIEGPIYECSDDTYVTEQECTDEGETWDLVSGYDPDGGSDTNPGGNGDASEIEHNRYLATETLAKISDGRLVLNQVRWDAGQFPTATTTAP